MRRGSARPLVESAMLATLSAVLMLLAFYTPVIGMAIGLVYPQPVTIPVIRHRVQWGLLASIVGALVLFPFMGWVTAASLWIGFGWVGLVFGYSVMRRYSYTAVLFLTSVAVVVGALAGLLATYLISGLTPLGVFEQTFEAFRAGMELSKKIVGDSPQLQEMIRLLTDRDALLRVIPGSFVLAGILMSYINVEVMRRFLPRFGYDLEPLPPFRRWFLPEIIAWVGLLSFVALVFLGTRPEQDVLSSFAQNVYMVASMLGTLQVFSLIVYFMLGAGYSKAMVGLGVLILLNLTTTSPIFSLLTPIFGMMDMLLDFRRIRTGRS